MAQVEPFRPWRYNTALVGGLDRVAAPPYDVIGPELQAALYDRSPHNVVRVDLGKTLPSDGETDNRYTRAASLLDDWRRQGALVRDQIPGITMAEESFTGPDGLSRVRRGFLACLRLAAFDEGVVFPHEATLSGPKEDRFRLMEATGMSLSPVFMLYSLPDDAIMAAWDASGRADDETAGQMTDAVGTTTRLWRATDPGLLETVRDRLQGAPLLIADGHHRYETALRYREARRAQGADDRGGAAAWEYALVYLVNMADPGLAIFGTHRLLRDLPPQRLAALPQELAPTFAVDRLADDPGRVRSAIEDFLSSHEGEGGAFGLWAPSLGAAYGLVLRDPAAVRRAVPDRTPAYQQLDVTILHTLILQARLGVDPDDVEAGRHLAFVKEWDEAFERLERGEYQAGFFMNPTRLEQVREVALTGERMPQKSTYFYPKLPTGLLFHDLTGRL